MHHRGDSLQIYINATYVWYMVSKLLFLCTLQDALQVSSGMFDVYWKKGNQADGVTIIG